MFRAVLVALLVVHAGLVLASLRQNYVTVDEVNHVAAGLSYWETGTFRASRVNPPLTKMVAALPILLVRPNATTQGLRDNPDLFDIVCLGRLPGIVWSLVGGWLVYRWARELYGGWAGCLGAALWCFGPNVLAHAQLMTPDVPTAVVALAATYAFWHYLRAPSWGQAAVAGLLLGVAELTKFTLLLLYGVWPLLWLIYRLGDRSRVPPPLRREVAYGLAMGLLSLWVLNLGYGFAGTCRSLGEYDFRSRFLAGDPPPHAAAEGSRTMGNCFREHWLGSLIVPVPEDYLYGIDDQRNSFETRRASYLAGEWSRHGWWYYYLYALAVKVPVGVWGLVVWGLALTLSRHPSSARFVDELVLWLPAVLILAFVSSQTGINRHMRYVLPIFPFIIISTSKVAWFFVHGPWSARLLSAGLLLWAWGGSLAVYPHSLSYFNEVARGSRNGHAHLVDSNIDWGQDLLFLKDWLEKHPQARPLGLAYFNIVDPRIEGVEYTLPPPGPGTASRNMPGRPEDAGPRPGYFAVSINYLCGLEFSAPDGSGGWRWVSRQDYQYFRHFQPIATAGYSIYIYHLTADEVNPVRRQFGLPPLPDRSSQQDLAP